jgi:hypothetical protein
MGTRLTVSALAEHLGMTRANLSIVNGRSGFGDDRAEAV